MNNNLTFAHIEYSIQTKSIDIFTLGCDGSCKDCCNPELKNWDQPGYVTLQVISKVLSLTTKFDKLIDKFIIVGGDPVDAYKHYPNEFLRFLSELKIMKKPIYLFTRYELPQIDKTLFYYVDFIKTGAYIPELKCEDNISYGIKLATSNQKIFDVSEILHNMSMETVQ